MISNGVYAIRCQITGKSYIGSSTYVTKRIGKHFSKLRQNTHFNPELQADFNKFGENAFIWGVMIPCEDDDLMREEERDLVNSIGLDNLYNKNNYFHKPHRRGVGRPIGLPHTEETKQLIREKAYERYTNPEERLKAKNYRKGKTLPKSAIKTVTEFQTKLRGKPVSIEGEIYPSLRGAARELGMGKNTLKHRVNSPTFPDYFWVK